jgi:hypothetical protein
LGVVGFASEHLVAFDVPKDAEECLGSDSYKFDKERVVNGFLGIFPEDVKVPKSGNASASLRVALILDVQVCSTVDKKLVLLLVNRVDNTCIVIIPITKYHEQQELL